MATLTGHAGDVVRVAFRSNDQVLEHGGDGDGTLRIWNWRSPQPLVTTVNPDENDLKAPLGVRVNALALSPDGRHVAIGRENGKLERYDALGLVHRTYLNPEEMNERRAIEAVEYSPDGNSLAASILKFSPAAKQDVLPRTECDIWIRHMPDGREARLIMTAGDLVHALAFSPDGRFLAIGGGDAQAIVLRDLQSTPNASALELKGKGTVLWNVAFADDKPTLAFARTRPIPPTQWTWEGFDLAAQSVRAGSRSGTAPAGDHGLFRMDNRTGSDRSSLPRHCHFSAGPAGPDCAGPQRRPEVDKLHIPSA